MVTFYGMDFYPDYRYLLSVYSKGCCAFQWNTQVGEITRTPLGSYRYNKFKIRALCDFLTPRRWPRSSGINWHTASSLAQNSHRKIPLQINNFRGAGVGWFSSRFVSSFMWQFILFLVCCWIKRTKRFTVLFLTEQNKLKELLVMLNFGCS